jgi:hypothetical protein
MGKKPTPPKLSAEEQEAAARQKANEAFCKAAKDDQLAKAEEALAKGASVDFVNEVRVLGTSHEHTCQKPSDPTCSRAISFASARKRRGATA